MLNNEKELLEDITHGDMSAFGALMKHYSQGVYTLVVRIVGDECEAEELTQDVWMKVYKQLCYFSGRSTFSTWLYRIAYNAAISHARRKRQTCIPLDERRLASIDEDDVERMEADTSERNLEALAAAIEQLDAQDRALVTLHYYENRPIAECAEIIEQSVGNTKVRLHRIRKKLYILITDYRDEQGAK
jgi:RNA polymerase sigma-70 factor (ECF subfamily)